MNEWFGVAFWFLVATIALAGSASLQVVTRFGPGPGFFIRGLAFALIAMALAQAAVIITNRRRAVAPGELDNAASLGEILAADDEETPPITRGAVVRFVLLALSLFAYGMLIEQVGFVVSTIGLSWVAMVLLGRKAVRSLFESVIAVVLMRVLFANFLGVLLPTAKLSFLAGLGL